MEGEGTGERPGAPVLEAQKGGKEGSEREGEVGVGELEREEERKGGERE